MKWCVFESGLLQNNDLRTVNRKAACLVRVPTEVIKTRMQTATYGNLAGSSYAAAKLVLSREGLRGFYRGFGITVMREVC